MMSHRLYVFIRSDLESLTPGKAAAQVAHAASQLAGSGVGWSDHYANWTKEDRDETDMDCCGFGTTIVLDGGSFKDDDTDRFPSYLSSFGYSGVVKDPSYPIRDGKKTHLLPLVTCYWAFLDPDASPELREWLNKFKLYNGNHD